MHSYKEPEVVVTYLDMTMSSAKLYLCLIYSVDNICRVTLAL